MNDWADEKAREYNVKWWKNDWPKPNASLAALLREVEQAGWIDGHTTGAEEGARDMVPISADRGSVFIDGQGDVDLAPKVLAEVRRVVEEVQEGWHPRGTFANGETAELVCQLILSRLEKL